jgi:excinuclease ABC subunit C
MEQGQIVRASVKHFPTQAGVYLMRDQDDTIIYVGKAKNLRSRVRSYFSGDKDPKTAVLVKRIESVEYIVTQNEYEALLLENNLIKRWQPRYNINLKDGKTYPVIRITNEEYPRIFKTRNIVRDGSAYYGPFPAVYTIDTYLELVERLYPLRKCRRPVKPRQHPCLYYHIGRCAAVCAGKTDKEEYDRRVEGIKQLLAGETEEIKERLTGEMNRAAEELQYERAADKRDILRAIEALETNQQVIDFDPDVRDYIGFASKNELCAFVVFQMRGGKLIGTDMFRSESFGTDDEDVMQFVLQYYGAKKSIPATLYLPVPVDRESLQRYFHEKHDAEVQIRTPEEGRDSSVLNMAIENARQDLEKQVRERGNLPALEELAKVLSLPRVPLRVEGFDVAHIGGKHPVAAMVSFLNGVPDKSEYRRFHVKQLEGAIDDFQAMREIIARRYTRVVNEKLARPDLILVDGGRGQVSAAAEILHALGLEDVPLLGLAKRNEEIFLKERSEAITLPEGSPPLRLLQHVRDEAHRFATSFRAGMQQKDIALSTLEAVPGIGRTRSARIMQAFGSLETVAETPPDVLAKSCGIPDAKAREVIAAAAARGRDQPAGYGDAPEDRTGPSTDSGDALR